MILVIAGIFSIQLASAQFVPEPNEHCLYYKNQLAEVEKRCNQLTIQVQKTNSNYEKCIAGTAKKKTSRQRRLCDSISDRLLDMVTLRKKSCQKVEALKEDFPPECSDNPDPEVTDK